MTSPPPDLLDSFRVETVDKSARYVRMLRDLPAGLSEWAVHPSLGNAEARAMEPTSWQVRKADFDLDRGVWTKPSHRTKQKRTEHLPLSVQAVALVASMLEHAEADRV